MRKFSLLLSFVVVACALIMARLDIRDEIPVAPLNNKLCGYTIIEAGKGVNCNGDTIAITKIHSGIASLD